MKTFYVSIILFFSMVVIIVVNAIYINNVTNSLQALTLQLSDTSDQYCDIKLKNLSDHWEKNKEIIGLSTNAIDINRISDHISQLKASTKSGETVDFEIAKQMLLNSIERIRHLEKITLSNII